MGFGQQLIQQGHAAGHEEGHKEGHQKGREEALREQLTKLLGQRFGDLPATVQAKLESASNAELVRWFDRVLTASTLQELFS